jgi:hypothetical protein
MRWVLVLLYFLIQLRSEAYTPQMKDFLCGCEYCVTVNRGEPLDIASHFMRCHSWRKGMQETIDMMRKSQVPEVRVEELQKKEKRKEEDFTDEDKRDPSFGSYSWEEDELYGWIFSDFDGMSLNMDRWIYLEFLGWSWAPAFDKRLVYSYEYQWIYIDFYLNNRIIYWYDRRRWLKLKDFKGS